MSPNPQHGTPHGEAILAIRKLARQTGADMQDLLTIYVLEALLARISASVHRDDFVLKGGVLLAAFAVRRPTKDIDLQATGLPNDADEVADRIREIISRDLDDGVRFDASTVTASVIRDDDEYAGVRVRLVGALGTSRLTVGIDVNFGDPIWPDPQLITLPRLVALDQPPVMILGYPLAMVLAEKIVTAIDRGEANTRWRDYGDLLVLTRTHTVDADELRRSIDTVADYRQVVPTPLLPRLAGMPDRAQEKWRLWRARTRREAELPARFAEVLASVAAFADPVLTGVAGGSWIPAAARWEPQR